MRTEKAIGLRVRRSKCTQRQIQAVGSTKRETDVTHSFGHAATSCDRYTNRLRKFI